MNNEKLKKFIRSKAVFTIQIASILPWHFSENNNIKYLSYYSNNWGDALNRPLLSKMTNLPCRLIDINLIESYSWYRSIVDNNTLIMAIGSIINWTQPNAIVWGSGLMMPKKKIKYHPKKVLAVRGPLTAKILNNQGIKVPPIYGDPALLYPRYYQPDIANKKYKLGIIPHYSNTYSPLIKSIKLDPSILLIDVKSSVHQFIDQLCSCEIIASSSLHGLIAADAYEIPSVWIDIDSISKVHGGFKYHDYFASLKFFDQHPISLSELENPIDIVKFAKKREVSLDLDLLLSVFQNNIEELK